MHHTLPSCHARLGVFVCLVEMVADQFEMALRHTTIEHVECVVPHLQVRIDKRQVQQRAAFRVQSKPLPSLCGIAVPLEHRHSTLVVVPWHSNVLAVHHVPPTVLRAVTRVLRAGLAPCIDTPVMYLDKSVVTYITQNIDMFR